MRDSGAEPGCCVFCCTMVCPWTCFAPAVLDSPSVSLLPQLTAACLCPTWSPPLAVQETKQLRGQSRKLQTALNYARQDAVILAGQLEEARQEAADASALLAVARSRSVVLEKAWKAAVEVGGKAGRAMCVMCVI